MTKYPQYQVRDDSAELGTLSIVDEKGQTLFIRDRTCLGIHEDAYLLAAAPQLVNALEIVWDQYQRLIGYDFESDAEVEAHNALTSLVLDALNAAQGVS